MPRDERQVTVLSRSYPDVPGYPDLVIVKVAGNQKFACPASACPNPRRPLVKGGAAWVDAYGFLSAGRFRFECVTHWKYGKCLLLNDGGELPARYPNINHGGQRIISQVFVHKGFTSTWRGSAGCITVHPSFWTNFQSFFEDGDTGNLFVLLDDK